MDVFNKQQVRKRDFHVVLMVYEFTKLIYFDIQGENQF